MPRDPFDTDHDSADRKASAPSLDRLANTPLAVYADAGGLFAEIYGGALVSARRSWLVAVGCLFIAALAVIAIVALLPLKEVRPWYIEQDAASGTYTRPVESIKVEPNQAVIRSELARWVEATYTIDPQRTDELQRWALSRTADKAGSQAQEFRARERVFERIAREPELIREAKVSAVDATQKGTAFVFVTTTDRTGSQAPGLDQTRRYRVTLNYKLSPPTDEAKLLANPLGIFVTYFSDVEDRAK